MKLGKIEKEFLNEKKILSLPEGRIVITEINRNGGDSRYFSTDKSLFDTKHGECVINTLEVLTRRIKGLSIEVGEVTEEDAIESLKNLFEDNYFDFRNNDYQFTWKSHTFINKDSLILGIGVNVDVKSLVFRVKNLLERVFAEMNVGGLDTVSVKVSKKEDIGIVVKFKKDDSIEEEKMESKNRFEVLDAFNYCGRVIYVLNIKDDKGEETVITYYKSAGKSVKEGKTWEGEILPTIGVVGPSVSKFPELKALRDYLWGETATPEKANGWICVSNWFDTVAGRNFYSKKFYEGGIFLKENEEKIKVRELAFEGEYDYILYNFYPKMEKTWKRVKEYISENIAKVTK